MFVYRDLCVYFIALPKWYMSGGKLSNCHLKEIVDDIQWAMTHIDCQIPIAHFVLMQAKKYQQF